MILYKVFPETKTSLNSVEPFTLNFANVINNKPTPETKQCTLNSLADASGGMKLSPRSQAVYLSRLTRPALSLYPTDTVISTSYTLN